MQCVLTYEIFAFYQYNIFMCHVYSHKNTYFQASLNFVSVANIGRVYCEVRTEWLRRVATIKDSNTVTVYFID
jgi:hypothetical protein